MRRVVVLTPQHPLYINPGALQHVFVYTYHYENDSVGFAIKASDFFLWADELGLNMQHVEARVESRDD